jgi:hypothetical protein
MQLELPIVSLRWRRVTFIDATRDCSTAVEEIDDLYTSGADGLLVALNDEGFRPECFSATDPHGGVRKLSDNNRESRYHYGMAHPR